MELIEGFGQGVEKAKIIRAYANLLFDYFNGSEMSNEDREKLKKYGIGATLAKLLTCSGELIVEEEEALQRARQALQRMMQS